MSALAKAADVLMGKTYQLTLTKNYVSRWGIAQAVRELIQNALDSSSPFVYEFREDDGAWTLFLSSEFTTLPPQTLLLGATSKADDEDSIGSFGEGYKLALLVLTREGIDVDVLNGERIWKPRFRMSRDFGEELLVIDETFGGRANKGLTFVVRGLSASDVASIRASCLKMQDDVGQVKRTPMGDILMDQAGKLYVGDLFICTTDLKYGYNVAPKHMTLERDRQTVSDWDLKDVTLRMWYATGETTLIAAMIESDVSDVEHSRYEAPDIVKEECYRIFKAKHPGQMIAASHEEMQRQVEAGLRSAFVGGGGFHSAVSSAPSYKRDIASAGWAPRNETPYQKLEAFYRAHSNLMRRKALVAFKSILSESKKWRD